MGKNHRHSFQHKNAWKSTRIIGTNHMQNFQTKGFRKPLIAPERIKEKENRRVSSFLLFFYEKHSTKMKDT